MTAKKILSCLLASAMLCGAFVSCGDKKDSGDKESSAKESSAETNDDSKDSKDEESKAEGSESGDESKAPVAVDVDDIQFETPVAAGSGDAYLAIVDGQWWIQYWGKIDDASPLAYDAGVAHIDGDGEYTVSVNADTNGFRYDTTGDANGECVPSGLSFAAVRIDDGLTLWPNMSIEITSVKVNGSEVPLTAKSYTSSDDGVKEVRANIYNSYVPTIPEDAHTADGNVYGQDDTYKAQIVDPAAFADGWSTVEVTFNVTGTQG